MAWPSKTMNQKVLDMVVCPYCDEEWIIDDKLVCNQCEPKFKTDMLLSDLLACIEALSKVKIMTPSRAPLLNEAIGNLQAIKARLQET